MKTALALLLTGLLVLEAPVAGQVTQEKQKRVIQTPFGPKEIEETVIVPARPPETPPTAAPAPASSAPVVVPPTPQPTPSGEAAPSPVAPASQVPDDTTPIQLHMDNADIHQIIRIIGDHLGLNYVVDPSIKGTVNISTSASLRRSDLLPILETILKINGATMVRNGNFYQIVPAASAIRQPLQIQDRAATPLADDQMVIQIVRLKYVAAEEMARLLTPYISEGASIGSHPSGNVLMISERRSNLRKLLDIVDLFDTNVFENERVRMFALGHNQARFVVEDLKDVFAGYALSERNTGIRFVPIERLNSILVVTANAEVFPEVERWIQRLDQPTATGGVQNFVYEVRNSKAIEIQKVLASLYDIPNSRPTASVPAVQSALNQTAMNQSAASPASPSLLPTAAPAQADSRLQAVNISTIRIIADETNNALVVQATPQEYAEIEKTIRQLDILPRQVLIDAQVYEVVLDDSLSFGLSAILQNKGTLPRSTTAQFASGPDGGPASLTAQTFAFIGRTRELLFFLNATENRSRVKTLSAPSVLVSDNMIAQFQVGTEVPIPVSSSVTPVQSDGTNLFAQTIQFRNTGVILQVKPQINQSGNVTLEISQEISQAGTNTVSAIVAPVIGKSAISTTVVIEDSQTIALGGFIRESQEVGRNRVPLIGRVPGLGILFGNTTRSSVRTELIVLITPHVLRNSADTQSATEELKTKLREIRNLINK